MAVGDWSTQQKLRVSLMQVATKLAAIKHRYQLVAAVSSRMVGNRIQEAQADYWKAVKAFDADNYKKTATLVKAALVEIGFIEQLLDAETTERELGESVFFEYGDKHNAAASQARLKRSLDCLAVELQALAVAAKRGLP